MLDKANQDQSESRSKLPSSSKRSLTLNKSFADKNTIHTRLASSLNKPQPDKSVGYIRRMVIDSGNPRYAASKHSTFLGGLTTGQHVKNRFKIPVDTGKPIVHAKLDEDLFGAEGRIFNTLHHGGSPKHLITSPRSEMDNEKAMLRPDEMIYEDREELFMARMNKGGSMDAGMDSNFEATTVATSAVYPNIEEASSQVPTSFYAQKINDYSKRLKKEQEMREQLE